MSELVIQSIQFKRGHKAVLEKCLSAAELGPLLAGEPAYELDTGKLKIGDGITDYIDLPYIIGEDNKANFAIQDPIANQILLYDAGLGKWVNKDLADTESLVYLSERGLTIKGYDTANVGQMLVKDHNNSLTWLDPVSTSDLDERVNNASTAASQASASQVQAGNFASSASNSADRAELALTQIKDFVEKKFWVGSVEEYNALESLDEGTFYFIKSAV